jgi:uncharacterized protein
MKPVIHLRFYEELNDHLPPERKKRRFSHVMEDRVTVGSLLQEFGIPLDQVELVLANGASVDFSYSPRDGDFISYYPLIESLDVGSIIKVRGKVLRKTSGMRRTAPSRVLSAVVGI